MLAGGEPAQARFLTKESVEIFRTVGDEVGLAHSLANLGAIVLSQRDHALALSLLEESLMISRKIGDDWMLSLPLKNLGVAAFRRGDPGRAVALLKESLTLLRDLGDKLSTSRNLECLAVVVSAQGNHGLAARLFGAGEALREAIGAPVLFYLIDYDGAVSATRDALGVEAFMAAWDEGRAMTLEEAIIHALEEPATQEEGELTRRAPARGTSAAEDDAFPGSYPDGLTAREAEVLRLLAEGRTNKQIAAELFLSVSTVQRHVANVYTKIGAHRRAQATAYALSKGLARTRPEQDLRSTTEPPG